MVFYAKGKAFRHESCRFSRKWVLGQPSQPGEVTKGLQGQIQASTNGVVIKKHRFAGEFCGAPSGPDGNVALVKRQAPTGARSVVDR